MLKSMVGHAPTSILQSGWLFALGIRGPWDSIPNGFLLPSAFVGRFVSWIALPSFLCVSFKHVILVFEEFNAGRLLGLLRLVKKKTNHCFQAAGRCCDNVIVRLMRFINDAERESPGIEQWRQYGRSAFRLVECVHIHANYLHVLPKKNVGFFVIVRRPVFLSLESSLQRFPVVWRNFSLSIHCCCSSYSSLIRCMKGDKRLFNCLS